MWETFISWYINHYLGKYVEDLNSQQLSFALRQGELELENVPLKKNIFRNWGLPVEVKSSVVGRIRIEFNLFKYLRNEPVLITIEDICVVAGPLDLSEWDSRMEAELAHEAKMSALDAYESRWKAQFDLESNSPSYYSSLYFSSMRIGASIVTKVVENLQLSVKNVHIRFEEEIGNFGRIVAFGITLESLTAQSCDSQWIPFTTVPGNIAECSFKTLQLNKFGIYFDTKAEKLSNIKPNELKSYLNRILASHEYLLCPVSAEARIAKNNATHPLPSTSKARFDVFLTLEKVPLQLSDSQYRQLVKVLKSLRKLERNCRLRHYRPRCKIKENAREWWEYCVHAVLSVRGYKRRKVLTTWEEVYQRGLDNVAYVSAYEQHLLRQMLSSDIEKFKDKVEMDLHYDEIIELRKVAMRRVEISNRRNVVNPTAEELHSNSRPPTRSNTKEHLTEAAESSQPATMQTSVLSWLFPSWTGTAEQHKNDAERIASETFLSPAQSVESLDQSPDLLPVKSESELDEAILDDMKAFGRDALLARFTFNLRQGMVTLRRKNGPFLELDFGGVGLNTELKPRSGAHKFKMTLATLMLRDCTTSSLIVSPHSTAIATKPGLSTRLSKEMPQQEPLFSLVYERKPTKKYGNRITVTTKPLDLVIYPALYDDLGRYFATKDVSDDLMESPHNGYEAVKQKTKEELRIYWERLIHQKTSTNLPGGALSWEIHMDIYAPQIVIHGPKFTGMMHTSKSKETEEKSRQRLGHSLQQDSRTRIHFSSGGNSRQSRSMSFHEPFLVIDLGRFRFTNCQEDQVDVGKEKEEDTEDSVSDDNEEFMTPCSSPVGELSESTCANSPHPSLPETGEAAVRSSTEDELCFGDSLYDIQAKLYKKYRLEITDVQVIIVEGKAARDGNWKSVILRGTSILHLVDKFSINLQLEHRLIYSEDPLWPALTIVATLPKLNLHFNEMKVQTIHSVMDSFFKSKPQVQDIRDKLDLSFLSTSQINLIDGDVSGHNIVGGDKVAGEEEPPRSEKNNSKLFLAQFTIHNVSVELQSKGRSIAELQVMGARTTLTRRSVDTSISFVIHSLLLADAVQTFGPDFELLLASHKHVSMDSVSGSLRDSDPTSPMSPQSPSSPLPFANQRNYTNQLAIPSQLHDALVTSLQAKKRKNGPPSMDIQTPSYDLNALITAELVFVNTDEEISILNVQFNNLDVIANQETIVEIIQFIQSVMPTSESSSVGQVKSVQQSMLVPNEKMNRFQASLDFHRLNVLLLRGVVGKDGKEGARKIATATACEAKVNISFNGESLSIEGSLGGLQMLNLTPEGQHHQRAFSVGQDPLLDSTYNVFTSNLMSSEIPNGNESALTFSYEKTMEEEQKTTPKLTLRMASVIYTHCPIFLIDLKKCIHQFQAPLTNKLKSAAAQIALGLVRQEILQARDGGYRSPLGSLSTSLDPIDIDGDNGSVGDATKDSPGIQLDVVLDSPVIVLPKNRCSSQVLVANLGQITVTGNNRHSIDEVAAEFSTFARTSTPDLSKEQEDVNYSVFICDVSLYSLNLKERWRMMDNLKMTYPTSSSATLMRAQELYFCDPSIAVPILHNTVIQFSISYTEEFLCTNVEATAQTHSECPMTDLHREETVCGSPKLTIRGRVVNPLKVSLTPQQYAQVLDSLGNITVGHDEYHVNEVNTVERQINWQKEVGSFHRKVLEPLPLPSPTRTSEDGLPISVCFEIPELIVELVSANANPTKTMKGMPELSLSCSELCFTCDKVGYIMEINVSLKSLILEDKVVPVGCHRRMLAMSSTPDDSDSASLPHTTMLSSKFRNNSYCSRSCPNLAKSSPIGIPDNADSFLRNESTSLPDHLDPGDILTGRFTQPCLGVRTNRSPSRKRKMSTHPKNEQYCVDGGGNFCPATPPPSPRLTRENKKFENLVQIQILLVDSKSPNFVSKYHGTHKRVDVDFSTLEVLLTPDTFSSLRKFFADAALQEENSTSDIGSSVSNQIPNKIPKPKINLTSSGTGIGTQETTVTSAENVSEERNTETRIHVKALRVKLAGTKETLAEAVVSSVHCEFTSIGKNYFGVHGRLGSLQVRDVSPFSGRFPVKFVFQGKQALDFDYTRTGKEGKFRLKMASVVCVHTHRFYSAFSNLWSALFSRPPTPNEDVELTRLSSQDGDGSRTANDDHIRVCLDIQAGAPVLLFPYSSTSESVLVADLGHLSVKNKFITEPSSTLFDLISVELIEMDLYSAELQRTLPNPSSSNSNFQNKVWILDKNCAVIKSSNSPSFLKDKCALNLKLKRFVYGILPETQASTSVRGVLSTVYCTLDCEKYKFIRGFLEHNIGEKIDAGPPPSPSPSTRYSRGTSAGRATPDSDCTPLGNAPKLDLAVELDLVNVSLNLVQESGRQLSRIDFLKSKFTFQNYSDGTKDIDLASQEILISDARYDQLPTELVKSNVKDDEVHATKNVFKNILQQSLCHNIFSDSSKSQTSTFQTETPLQAEIHYRQTQRGTRVTIVLNNMRLMLILDWWMEIREFLSQPVPAPPSHVLVGGSEDNSGKSYKARTVSPLLERSKDLASPVAVSAGIVTKRAPVLDVPISTFELKINVTDCELVMVEDPSLWDTNAVILKSTAMLCYKPHLERPISCSLIQCELFSCIVGLESDSALSILDPTDITIDLLRKTKVEPQGILDATSSPSASSKILRITSPQLNLRLSYYDMKMFVQIMERFSKQAQIHLLRSETADIIVDETDNFQLKRKSYSVDGPSLHKLLDMGFEKFNSIEALHICGGQVEEAALMLSQEPESSSLEGQRSLSLDLSSDEHAVIADSLRSPVDGGESIGQLGILCDVEVKCICLSLCVIDDCKDADVPFLELSVSQLELCQSLIDNSGRAECILASDYYNRELSGWEPFLEPWKCSLAWKRSTAGTLGTYSPSSEFPPKAPELGVSITSKQVINFNVTSTLLNLYGTVLANWSEDYMQQKFDRRRAPFVPFALENETGSTLHFSTMLSNNEEILKQKRVSVSDDTKWISVSHGATQAFSFEGRGKLRHRNTHQLRTHQLVVRLDGWKEITPVSVDKVGTYFRVAKAATSLRRGIYSDLPTTRVVFEVSVQGSAQKLVRVRSALKIRNALPDLVELKLENPILYPSLEDAQSLGSYTVQVVPGQVYSIPLHSVFAHMWVRPIQPDENFATMHYCSKSLLLANSQEGLRECQPMSTHQNQPYRFCVAVKRDEFPADEDDLELENVVPTISQLMSMNKRANLVTLFSPLTIVNLLPTELNFEIRNKDMKGQISAGKECSMINVDISESLEVFFWQSDSFPQGALTTISSTTTGYVARLKVTDVAKRVLLLTLRVQRGEGGSLTLLLSCPFWIVNKTGLPIVCKQEGSSGEAAGQSFEHEIGRMVAPLLFSFSDQEGANSLALRVGNGLHKDSKPIWCRSFQVQSGTRVRKLVVKFSSAGTFTSSKPEAVYLVGIEIKNGKGRYRDSRLVTISPHFVVDNRSSKAMKISQHVFATSFSDMAAEATHLMLPSNCSLPFHWPRLDKPQLLCVKLTEADGGLWSGGFCIENVDSFHINIRNMEGHCHFLRVEIILQGPTFFVIFSDTDQLPPPFRVDNMSSVPITFHQTIVPEDRLKLTVRAECSLPYSLDETTKPANLTLAAPGGTSVMVNMDVLNYQTYLTYENFFYIALTATFPRNDDESSLVGIGLETLELVLDVPEGSKVILNKKEPGKRSQLWRVNADGLIEHEGSSPPRDPKKSSTSMLVLDIAGTSVEPTQYAPLMLRKPDKQRASTQHWEFTADGRLKCFYDNLFVQGKDGFEPAKSPKNLPVSLKPTFSSWKQWSDVVLGPSQPDFCYVRTETGIPAEQAVGRQKLRPGSGRLALEVGTDGPTRVLRIIDTEHKPRRMLPHHFEEASLNTIPKLLINLDLKAGLGISIVNCKPREELIYAKFSNVRLKWKDSKKSQSMEVSVENLQIDNSLFESEKYIAVYVTPTAQYDTQEDLTMVNPSLHLSWERMKSRLNAHVFKSWELIIQPLNVILEERLLLKLCQWVGLSHKMQSVDQMEDSDFEVQKALKSATSLTARRFYFGILRFALHQVRLSVLTTSKLVPDLALVKRRMGLTLIRFEEALVELDEFIKLHPFETFDFLTGSLFKHYKDELLSQAAIILGSTDFLGNPIGFVNDVSVGVSGLIYEGSIGSLVKNVTHGISNSAAKVTGSLGDGLGRTTLDDKHEEERRKIRIEHSCSSGEHLYAGLKGLGHGLIGGVTSIAAQSFEGASNDGFSGLLYGFGKGIVGTVTKPAVGILDLATGAASAIRDSSRTSSRMIPKRIRPTRVVVGNGGLLPPYSETAARGQEILFEVNDRNFNELFIGCESLKSGSTQDLRILISSEAVTIFKAGKGHPNILKIPMSEMVECYIPSLNTNSNNSYENNPYIEFVRKTPDLGQRRPQVKCESEQIAKKVVQQVNYAKVLYEEMRHSQIIKPEHGHKED